MVGVRVGEQFLQLPEHAPNAGASHLRLASGEYVGLQDYADSVGGRAGGFGQDRANRLSKALVS
jgi:hypothetical protein